MNSNESGLADPPGPPSVVYRSTLLSRPTLWLLELGSGLDTDGIYLTSQMSPCTLSGSFGDFRDLVAMDQSPRRPYGMPPTHGPGDNRHAQGAYRSSSLSNDFVSYIVPFTNQKYVAKPEVFISVSRCNKVCSSASFSGTYRGGNLRRNIATRHRENVPDGASWIFTKFPAQPTFCGTFTSTHGHHREGLNMENVVDQYSDTSPESRQDCGHWECGDCSGYHEPFPNTSIGLVQSRVFHPHAICGNECKFPITITTKNM
jgi:hypothetical protein